MMRAMPYNLQQVKGIVEENSLYKFQQAKQVEEEENLQVFSGDYYNNNSIITTKSGKNNKINSNNSSRTSSVESEPTSTLDTTSTSTLKYGSDLHHPLQTGSESLGFEDLDTLFPNNDGSLLPWIMGDPVDPGLGFKHLLHSGHPFNVGGLEGQVFNPQFTNPNFVMSSVAFGGNCQQFDQFQPHVKGQNPGFLNPNPFVVPGQGQQLGVKEQLFMAADSIQTGNFSLAHEILARLNHQLLNPTKPPLVRAALYVKDALETLLQLSNSAVAPKSLSTYDVVHKMNAYKAFSEVSPITQFVNFTCTQAILESLDDFDAIHVLDFDIGCGAQWASLIQELPLRKRGAPSLQITAFAPSSTHPFELALVRDNLVQFANDAGVAFDLQVVSLDSFDPSSSSFPNFRTSENECVAVSFPIWSLSHRPSTLPSILRFIHRCSPKIVVSWDRGFDRYDVPFPQHLIHSLESSTNFMESLDGLNVAPNTVNTIGKFLLQPRIENTVLGRLHAPDKMPHWKNLFASEGLTPLQFSNFTETQADYIVKRTPGQGFRVEKRQASLVLRWQNRDLVEASAWRC
ncbi:hypothetical protein RND81_08G129800 [Saponaria officinalis]|uniref:Uncharacterized protein n=1 Tax=Saponaria officinalis TaxID=3572 RepID=A0AAW1J7M3_SAPOF